MNQETTEMKRAAVLFVIALIASATLLGRVAVLASENREPAGKDSSIWYLAEGSTAWGFDTVISVLNPNFEPVTCTITFMTEKGARGIPQMSLPAQSQTTLNPATWLGEADFSTRIQCNDGKRIAIDRSMYWTPPGTDTREGHCSIGVTAPANTWYLAEGSSAWGFETWLLVQNPNSVTATCNITYMIEGEEPHVFRKTVPPNSRSTFSMKEDIGEKDASIRVESDLSVIAERAMYRNNRRCGHNSIGTTAPATDVFLAEGTTAHGFTEWVLVQNPNPHPVSVDMTYMLGSYEGSVSKPQFTMDPNSRRTVLVNADVADKDLSTKVSASGPVVAERAMYWNSGTGEAGHVSIGLSGPGMVFYLPDGQSSEGFETWTLVMNPNDDIVSIKVTYLTPSGNGNVSFIDYLIGNSRETYSLADELPNSRAAILVESLDPGLPIICERAVYFNGRSGGHNTIGGSPEQGHVVVTEHRGIDSGHNSFWVHGTVRNDTPQCVHFVQIAATFYDSSGGVVGSKTGYADISVLDPADTSPFKAMFFDFPASLDSYSLDVEYQISKDRRNRDVIVTSHGHRINEYGDYIVTGTVRNNGSSTRKYVKVCITFRKPSGEILSNHFSYVSLKSLMPGQTASFECKAYSYEGVGPLTLYAIQVCCQD